MSTINFVPKQKADKTQLLRVRKLVVVITTGVLVVYLIAIAGIVGWWWYKKTQEQKTSARIEAYLVEMNNYRDREVWARKLQARADGVKGFLDGRGQASEAAKILTEASDVEVADWKYDAGGSQEVKVKAEGPGQLFIFSKYMEERYRIVQPDEIGWTILDGWYGRFLISGIIKQEV